jgi:hypothetical protein
MLDKNLLERLLASDQETLRHLEVPGDVRKDVETELSWAITDRNSYAAYTRRLLAEARNLSKESSLKNDLLPPTTVANLLAGGTQVLDGKALAALMLNPRAINQVSTALAESDVLPEAWIDAVVLAGEKSH